MKPKDEWHIGQLRQVFPGLAAVSLGCAEVSRNAGAKYMNEQWSGSLSITA
jgi:hypothetical protein